MQKIKYEGQILAIIYREEDWVKGLNFLTPDDMFVQVGSWWYDKGKILDKHVHKDFDRVAKRTQECVYMRKGSMRVTVYTENLDMLDTFDLKEGEMAVFAYGGHGYEILEDDTQVIESKNGPFIDVETDKTKF
ncbi:hypothetical protein N9884_06290 [Gammaproteobacteria bacterium]|jgi:hypothetical protein|nr:hypothetical protein [Gammaproteobacteria bacterium]|tara:strand:+ start:2307 stop:2705 length:399 start_codon:yes stop_codon:yes gene_type:complete